MSRVNFKERGLSMACGHWTTICETKTETRGPKDSQGEEPLHESERASFKTDQPRKKIAENQSNEDDDEDLFSFGYSDDDMPAKLEPKSEGSDDGEGIDIKEEDSEDAY
ncbi:hypothetical protein FOPG_02367 [Fusarium oxysporum f. sp. conglutinans race 2 54008]|uniref:Uncharacterized protein n=1 Tax=Fusarium oxysporum f. sp. conglutinans race 2 54008 TaxID=1089457 RepID=X0I9J9_FUSOX|nr:hypothetical protein FOPG_02367 [Fusarium oxysporum f. sp. conglutinans race 2 54008]